MNNFENIKNMTLDEMAEWLANRGACDYCVSVMEDYKCMAIDCVDGVKQWLQQESEE